MQKYQIRVHILLPTHFLVFCIGQTVWTACTLHCRQCMFNLRSASFPHTLNISAWPFTLALQTSVELYKCIPLAFHGLISASDRKNVKHKHQYHLGLRECFSSGSQKMDENMRAHHVLLQLTFYLQFSGFLYQTEAGEVDSRPDWLLEQCGLAAVSLVFHKPICVRSVGRIYLKVMSFVC